MKRHDTEQLNQVNSRWRPIALGVVIKDKDPKSDKILVLPIEMLSQEDGLIKEDTKVIIDETVVNQDAKPIPAKFDRKSFFTARWFNGGNDGRQTAPDVVAGETVELWQYSDDQTYWWKTIFREPGLRRKEHVVFAFGNIEEKGEVFDMSSSYGFMFSTRDKKIRIWSTTSDGEPNALEMLFETDTGNIRLRNDNGCEFGIDSRSNSTWMKTSGGAVSIRGSNIAMQGNVNVSGSLKVNGRNVRLE